MSASESTESPGTLHVVAVIPLKADVGADAHAALGELVAATRAEEGCLAYEGYASAAAPGTFITVEEWRSQADLDAHMQTPHVAKAFEVLGPVLVGEVAIHPLQPLD